MGARILVAYASRNGSTAEIAQAIGRELQSAGYAADVAEVKTISSLEGYQAVVIGGPLYMGKVVSEIGKFVGRHAKELGRLPVAAFAVGTTPVNGTPDALENARKSLRTGVTPLVPVAETVFAGRLILRNFRSSRER